ncbi:carbon storage regulator CsrA [Brevibacillus sp. BC25]|uniref:carbon storage regulator CsrA n=1 Tax=Brevibacillus sp. BC25 TaxID=1144308 RepID=UPI0002714F53|nr:carbon storage regulator CsrA [Brevibacillus sp. BC25]EJL22882.1 carbon storage regulator CsrA [Brevibacillus sp. BC25]
MLVLSRKKNESIIVSHDIEIKVISIEGETVRLGIEAPRDVEIYRKELYMTIQEENRLASESAITWASMKAILMDQQSKRDELQSKKEDDEK